MIIDQYTCRYISLHTACYVLDLDRWVSRGNEPSISSSGMVPINSTQLNNRFDEIMYLLWLHNSIHSHPLLDGVTWSSTGRGISLLPVDGLRDFSILVPLKEFQEIIFRVTSIIVIYLFPEIGRFHRDYLHLLKSSHHIATTR
jgi:hypothetical protein